ncbi:hypothetical protein MK079_05160 [Candidatus Gracilibacteria bacterium]|nr:hypothetical protein [Candidatus Gracilibacteria bacterium]
MKEKTLQNTHDILYKNLTIDSDICKDFPVICIYDTDSLLSRTLAEGYIQNLKNRNTSECIDFNNYQKEDLKEKLLSLPEGSSVVLVQSTNFRLDDFRIRLHLKNAGVGCIEHNHLGYIPDEQAENYIDSLEYRSDYYETLSDTMQEIFEPGENLKVTTSGGNTLTVEGGFEEIKRNTGDYSNQYRGGTFPIGENFTEAKDFSRVNGKLTLYAYPDERYQVQFCEPFEVEIKESILSCSDPKCPQKFRELMDQIAEGEDGEVYVRELGFGMNTGISKQKRLSHVGAFERVSGFHISLGKKHNIYRKKFPRSLTQRFHIDVFPDVESISVDGKMIFEDGKYVV